MEDLSLSEIRKLNNAYASMTDIDSVYFSLIRNGKEKEAFLMLRKRALEKMPKTKVKWSDGLPLVVYHGTDLENTIDGRPFTEFGTPSHFGTRFQAEKVSSKYVFAVFLNIENPGTANDTPKNWNDTHSEWWWKIISANPLNDGFVYVNDYESNDSSVSYMALKPNQIKSAELITYDDSGNQIPLSQRFQMTNSDIRF